MSEIEQLKKCIDDSGKLGVETAFIRDDYEPAGAMMIRDLCAIDLYTAPPDQDARIRALEEDCRFCHLRMLKATHDIVAKNAQLIEANRKLEIAEKYITACKEVEALEQIGEQ